MISRRTIWRLATAGSLIALPSVAAAQRTDENVTTQSEDGFGRQVGNEKSGIYTVDDVRGFNPVDAGNVRIEGLYFDQVDRLSPRLLEGNSVRVGYSALRFPFPAPLGLIDYHLAVPTGKLFASADLSTGSPQFTGLGATAEINIPIAGDDFAIFAGAGFRNVRRTEGGGHHNRTYGGTIVWRPYHGARLIGYGGVLLLLDEEARPQLFPIGTELPPRMDRGIDLSQPWADRKVRNEHAGLVAQLPVGTWSIEAGLFGVKKSTPLTTADLLRGVGSDGTVANRVIVAETGNHDESMSGEVRAVRSWTAGHLRHTLTLSVRGRRKNRLFGGSDRINLGPSTLLVPDVRAEPIFTIGAKSHDRVRQITGGIAYNLRSHRGFSVDVSASRSRYRKGVDFADPLLADLIMRDGPWLGNLAVALPLSNAVIVYAGATRGQEEALVAPEIAVNRSEAPPALRTSQIEVGARLALGKGLTSVIGAFRITKPYFNLDPGLRYRDLGRLANQGVEFSLAGEVAPGLTLVGGMLFADPKISGEAVDTGLIGAVPIGQGKRRAVLNIDWRTDGGKGAWSFDLAAESVSRRTVDTANLLSVPARSTLVVGSRFRFTLGGTKLLLRGVVQNLFNGYGWQVSNSGALTYTPGRSAYVQMIADF